MQKNMTFFDQKLDPDSPNIMDLPVLWIYIRNSATHKPKN